ncbi:YfhO family protein [Enterococcus rotai]|uniref:YfhO family protein n=1 Tax=Enterococcus rotai TaxID=118060 RepID=UPI0035C7863C
MKKQRALFFSGSTRYAVASFVLPIVILAGVYFSIGIYPGSKISILASDGFGQYANFFASFNNLMKSDQSIYYTWFGSLGLNYLSLISYYLGGIFTPFVYFFDNQNIPDFIYYLTLVKVGFAGLAFWFFSTQTFHLPKWGKLLLSVSYALMGFTIANSEMVMWLDGLIYFPLVILGIHLIMDKRQPWLLFISYFLLFISNFYIGFMIGVYSFLYFVVRLFTNRTHYLKCLPSYLLTSLLAGGASMVLLFPALVDLRTNGEALTTIKSWKTAATGPWDLVVKNMVGVYDTTRYGSIPFIYVGLLPLVFCLFFFLSKKILLRKKICYGLLLIVLVTSFYVEPLNLFWHGLHAPNMFLFRFSFLFSFTILLLAGYGWSVYKKEDFEQAVNIFLGLLVLFTVARVFTAKSQQYDYLTYTSFILTLIFLAVYLVFFFCNYKVKGQTKILICLFMGIFFFEVGVNTLLLVKGIQDDWGYAERSGYEKDYKDIQKLVKQTKNENDSFYRMENNTASSPNESFRYGYSGIGLFSSIRNRHSSFYMNTLGFRSYDTNLSIRYQNNTILMDTLMGVKYNLSSTDVSKAGFEKINTMGDYQLYKNQYALPMGILTDEEIYDKELANDPASLLLALSGNEEALYATAFPEIIKTENVILKEGVKYDKNTLILKAKEKNKPLKIKWKIAVNPHSQVYLDLFPADFRGQERTEIHVTSDKQKTRAPLTKTGQFYSLGDYETAQDITVEAIFYYTDQLELVDPTVMILNTEKYAKAAQKAQEKGVEFQAKGRKATATVTTEKEQILFTTIPADKGWQAKVDGKKVPIRTINDGLLSISIPAGKHHVEFLYRPQGLLLGSFVSLMCIVSFGAYQYYLIRRNKY